MAFRKILWIFLVAASGIGVGACRKQQAAAPEEKMRVSVAYPQERAVTLYKEYPGYISSWNTVDIVARVSGYLQQSFFNSGALVKKGQLLFIIEPTLYEDAVEQAEAGVRNAQATLDYARNNYTRMKQARSSNAVSEIDLIQSRSNMQAAEASVAQAKAQLNTAKTNLGYCYIRSPYTGHIGLSAYAVGAYVPASASSTKLATVYQDSAVYAYFTIEDAQYLKIVENLRHKPTHDEDRLVEVFAKEISEPYIGRVDYLSPNIDLSTGTLTLRAAIDNPRGELKNGLYVVVRIKSGYDERATLVSNAAIGTDQLGKYLYVVGDDGKVSYRHIETGDVVDDTLCTVTGGIAPTERYVTRALLKVRDGMTVEPVLQNRN